jgi:hypothetical protein
MPGYDLVSIFGRLTRPYQYRHLYPYILHTLGQRVHFIIVTDFERMIAKRMQFIYGQLYDPAFYLLFLLRRLEPNVGIDFYFLVACAHSI